MGRATTIPVTILTGFLGSGKTTVLDRLLSNPEFSDTAVIINEFGEIGLDHLLVRSSTENLVLLNNGCLCCTVRGDLVETFTDLEARIEAGSIATIRRLVIETTGLADPAPILHTLMADPVVTRRWNLEGVITTVDAVNGVHTLDEHNEASRQVAVADRILLTKSDIASPEDLTEVGSRLSAIARNVEIVAVINGQVDPSHIFGVGPYTSDGKSADVDRWLRLSGDNEHHRRHHGHHVSSEHGGPVTTHSIVIDTPIEWAPFSYWLELLAALRGEKLLRVKGIVSIAEHPGRPLIIHGVQHVFHAPVQLDAWPSDDHRTRVVFITRNLDVDDIVRTLRKFGRVDGLAAGASTGNYA